MNQHHFSDLFLDQIKDRVWTVNSDYQLVYANKAYFDSIKKATGKETKLNESVFIEGFGDETIDKWRAHYKRAFTGETFEIQENFCDQITNETHYSQIIFNPLIDEDGKTYSVTCQSLDVTGVVQQIAESKQLMDASLDTFCTINEAGDFVFVSAAAEDHWGYLPEELLGKAYEDFILEEDVPKTREIAEAILGGADIRTFENRYIKKDGSIAYNLWSARWDAVAKLMYCVARNGKEKMEQEALIIQSEQRFKSLVQEGSDLIGILDQDGNYIYVSPTSTSILGMTPEEFIGRSPFDFIHPDDAEAVLESLQKIATEKKVIVAPFRFQNKKKEWRWLESVLTDMTQNPAVNGIVANSRDITDDKKLHELYKQTRQLAKVGSWEYDLLEDNLFWSEEVHRLHETDPATYVPNVAKAIDFYKEEHKSYVADVISKSLTEGVYLDYEAVIVSRSKKEKWIRVIGNPQFDGGKCVKFIGSFQDINERKEVESRLQSLSDNLPGVVFQYVVYPDGTDKLLYVSDNAKLIWGFSANEAMQNNQQIWKQIEKGGDLEQHKKSIEISIETKSLWKNRYKYVMPNNEIRTHLGYGSPTFLADGKIVFNSVILDITEESKNKELLEQAFNIARIGSWEVDLINNSIFWSDITHEIHETRENFKPQLSEAINFYREDFRELATQAVNVCIETGAPFDFEAILVTSKNNEVWVRAMGRAELLNGKCVRIFGSFQDIHERKTVTLALEKSLRSLEDYKHALDQAAIIAFTDDKGIITSVNDNFCTISKYNRKEIIGKTHQLINSKHHPSAFFKDLWKTIASGKVWRGEIKNKAKDGSYYWVDTTIVPFLDEKNKPTQYLAIRYDITDRKKTEKEKYSLHTTLENSLNEIYMFDSETFNFNYINKGALLNLGYLEEEIKALTPLDLIPEFTSTSFKKLVAPLINNEKKKIIFFTNHQRKDRSQYPVEAHLQLVKEGNDERFIAIILDITARKKAEEDLISTSERLSLATNAANVGVWDWDIIPNELIWDEKMYEIFNVNSSEFTGAYEAWVATVHPEDIDQANKDVEDALSGVRDFDSTFRIIWKDKSIHYIKANAEVTRDLNGNAIRMVGTNWDITKRKVAEQTILQANERFEKVTEATNDIIWDWDIVKENFYCSSAIDRFLGEGTAKSTKIEDVWKHFLHEEDATVVKKSLYNALEDVSCTHWEHEFRLLTNDKKIVYIIDRARIIRNDKGKAIRMVGAKTDITEQKELELQLKKLNQNLQKHALELERSNQELEQFAFVSSHDLQEPLRMITSFMDLLKRNYGDQLDSKANQYIYLATDGAERMKQIILDLLLYSRANKPSQELEEVDLNETLSDFKELRKKVIVEKSVVIHSDQLPIMKTHKAPITQVFHGILDNAIKYAKQDISPIILIQVKEKQDAWEFSVKDNGIGIDNEFFEKIFGIFQRLHNREQYEGTGIGLAVVKRSVEFLGGTIWVTSKVGEGSTFYFTIKKQQVISEKYEK